MNTSKRTFLAFSGLTAMSTMALAGTAPTRASDPSVRRVTFKNNNGITLVGHLHLPPSFRGGGQHPALIVVAPAGGAKEQSAGLYAKKLAKKGFLALAFDASFQGESGGRPRYKEDPNARVEDIRGAVDFLVSQSFVDTSRIGVLGLCAGGGYATTAAMTERRIKAVGLVVPVNGGTENRAGGPEAAVKTLQQIAAQRTAEAQGGAPMIVPWMPDDYKDAEDIDLREGYAYYRTPRGHHPKWQNKLRLVSLDAVMAYDAFHLSEMLLTQPLQVIVGSKPGSFGSNRDGHEVHKRAASVQKGILVMEGASHFDLYDIPKYVDPAVDKLAAFYDKALR